MSHCGSNSSQARISQANFSGIRLADDGLPLVSHVQTFYDSKGEVWRVRYRCGSMIAQISKCQGFCVLFVTFSQGSTREKRYSTWNRAYNGILMYRRKVLSHA